MRLDDLRELTTLPSERLRQVFRGERVLTVLPVSERDSGETTILVATPTKLGLARLSRPRGRSRWVTRWAPWDAVGVRVRLAGGTRRRRRSPSRLPVAIRIGGRTFFGVLEGAPGRAALRDFARTVRSRRRALDLPGMAA